jgi:hypothetical protein
MNVCVQLVGTYVLPRGAETRISLEYGPKWGRHIVDST